MAKAESAPDEDTVELEETAQETDLSAAGVDEPSLAPPSLIAALKHHNLDVDDDATDEEVLAHFTELEAAAEERNQLRQRTQQLEALYAQQQVLKPAPEVPKPEETKAAKREIPEWNPEWRSYLRMENGEIVPKDNMVNPEIVAKYKQRMKWQEDQDNLFRENPAEFLKSTGALDLESLKQEIEDRAYKRAVEEVQKTQTQTVTQSHLDAFAAENAAWLYADQVSKTFTPVGQLLSDRVGEHLKRGYGPQDALKYAQFDVEQTGKAPWKAKADAPKAEAPTPTQKKVALRAKAANNGANRIAQPPVTARRGHTEIIERPSMNQLAARTKKAILEQLGVE